MEAVVVPVTAAASALHPVIAVALSDPSAPSWAVPTWPGAVWVVAVGEAEERTGSWFPWLAGFIPGALVVMVAYLVLRRMRRGR